MNERLTIRNSHSEIFRWLPIGRCDVSHGSDGKPAGRDAADKRQYRGKRPDHGAGAVFSSQGRGSQEGARSSGLAEKDLTFYLNQFL
jgi:hypothetical protein